MIGESVGHNNVLASLGRARRASAALSSAPAPALIRETLDWLDRFQPLLKK